MSYNPLLNYKIGCDPEIFLVNEIGKFRSAHFLPGSKESPFLVENGAIQPDGTAAEFNISPAMTAQQFSQNIKSVLGQLKAIIEHEHPELKLRVSPTAHFDKMYFKKLPAVAKMFGCSPDYDAYTQKQTEFPGTRKPFRTGAGHIHVGWAPDDKPADLSDSLHIDDCIAATKQLDSVLYFSSLLWDQDTERRTLYGKIGCFRPKVYGVEYRPLSNAWVADPDLHIWIFNATEIAMTRLDYDGEEIFKRARTQTMIDMVREGKSFSKDFLIDYHIWLNDNYDIPLLPLSYISSPSAA